MTVPTLQVMAILFIAALVRSSLGFGEALVAVPLLALLLPIETAAPLVVLVSVTVAATALIQDHAHVNVRSAGRLVLATLPGIPLGLLILTRIPEPIVKGVLAVIIIGFSLFALLGRQPARRTDHDRGAWPFGFLAGVLGGAYGMNGPPLVIYGALRGWSPTEFRATLQGYFLPVSLMILAGYRLAGLWGATVTHLYLASLPALLLATYLGRAFNRRVSGEGFIRYVHLGLVLIGITLLVQSVVHS